MKHGWNTDKNRERAIESLARACASRRMIRVSSVAKNLSGRRPGVLATLSKKEGIRSSYGCSQTGCTLPKLAHFFSKEGTAGGIVFDYHRADGPFPRKNDGSGESPTMALTPSTMVDLGTRAPDFH